MGLQILSLPHYTAVRSLFPSHTSLPLYCHGVLAGKYPGKVLVDQVEQPRSALLIKDSWCHLIGDAHNEPFNEMLRLAFAEKQFIGEETNALFFIDATEAWGEVLSELVQNRQPIETARLVYVAVPESSIHPPILPTGFELHFIEESLLHLVTGNLPGDVQQVLDLRRGAELPDEMAFGFVALNGRSCAAWAVVDFMVGEVGEIRLVTETPYRRQGLALAASAATLLYALSHGLTQILWDVAASNTASIRTAEKLGLHLLHHSKEHVIIFPEAGYLINLAWGHLDNGRFAHTQQVAQTMITSDKKIAVQYGYFLLAAAWAGLKNQTKAMDYLNRAVDAGFDDLAEMNECSPFTSLYHTLEWQRLITRIETRTP